MPQELNAQLEQSKKALQELEKTNKSPEGLIYCIQILKNLGSSSQYTEQGLAKITRDISSKKDIYLKNFNSILHQSSVILNTQMLGLESRTQDFEIENCLSTLFDSVDSKAILDHMSLQMGKLELDLDFLPKFGISKNQGTNISVPNHIVQSNVVQIKPEEIPGSSPQDRISLPQKTMNIHPTSIFQSISKKVADSDSKSDSSKSSNSGVRSFAGNSDDNIDEDQEPSELKSEHTQQFDSSKKSEIGSTNKKQLAPIQKLNFGRARSNRSTRNVTTENSSVCGSQVGQSKAYNHSVLGSRSKASLAIKLFPDQSMIQQSLQDRAEKSLTSGGKRNLVHGSKDMKKHSLIRGNPLHIIQFQNNTLIPQYEIAGLNKGSLKTEQTTHSQLIQQASSQSRRILSGQKFNFGSQRKMKERALSSQKLRRDESNSSIAGNSAALTDKPSDNSIAPGLKLDLSNRACIAQVRNSQKENSSAVQQTLRLKIAMMSSRFGVQMTKNS